MLENHVIRMWGKYGLGIELQASGMHYMACSPTTPHAHTIHFHVSRATNQQDLPPFNRWVEFLCVCCISFSVVVESDVDGGYRCFDFQGWDRCGFKGSSYES